MKEEEISPEEMSFIGIGESKYYNYRCNLCGFECEVEDIVVDAFAASGELAVGEMPEMVCHRCGGTLQFVGD